MKFSIPNGMDAPRVIWPPVFLDRFNYRGKSKLPGAESLPSEWTVVSGAFTTADEVQLNCTSPGILRYTDTSLDELLVGLDHPDFSWVVRFYGQPGLDFSLRVRENASADTYLAIRVNFIDDTLTFTDKTSSATGSFEGDYTLRSSSNSDYYSIELWTLGASDYWVFVNGNPVFPIAAKLVTNAHEDYGFSLEVHNIPTGGGKFSKFAVHELVAYPTADLVTDESDLNLLFRQLMKIEVESPNERTWASFRRARMLWDLHKDIGHNNETWSDQGYPIREPLPEEWFGNT